MKNVQYPRACPKCGTVIRDQGNYSWHVRRCGTDAHRVTCPFCPITFPRMDICKRHIKNIHSKGAKRKVVEGECYFYWFPVFRILLSTNSSFGVVAFFNHSHHGRKWTTRWWDKERRDKGKKYCIEERRDGTFREKEKKVRLMTVICRLCWTMKWIIFWLRELNV